MNLTLKTALLRLYKNALICRSSEQGFAMVIALALGLVMLLVGGMMMTRSQGDKVNAIQQKDTDTSLAVAEAGVSQILAFVGKNSEIAPYQLSEWLNSSTQYTNIPCGRSTSSISTEASTYTGWNNLNGKTQNKFKLVNYTYQPDNGTAHSVPGTGTIEIEAQSGVNTANPNGTSRQDLKVTIRVSQINIANIPVPGMWVNTNSSSGTSNLANIVAACGADISGLGITSGATNPATGQPWQAVTTSIGQPTLPTMPGVGNGAVTGNIPSSQDLTSSSSVTGAYPRVNGSNVITDTPNVNGAYEYLIKESQMSGVTIRKDANGNDYPVTFYMVVPGSQTTSPSLPLSTNDIASTDPNSVNRGRYVYIVDTFSGGLTFSPPCLNASTSSSCLTSLAPLPSTSSTPQSKQAVIYLKGDGGTVTHTCPNTNTYNNAPSGTFNGTLNSAYTGQDCSLDLIVYGYGNASSSYVSTPPAFALNGNSCEYNIFLFAPTYYLSHSGGGNCGHAAYGDLVGMAWVANWSGSGGGNHTGVRQDPTATWANILATGIQLSTPAQITPTTSWQQGQYH